MEDGSKHQWRGAGAVRVAGQLGQPALHALARAAPCPGDVPRDTCGLAADAGGVARPGCALRAAPASAQPASYAPATRHAHAEYGRAVAARGLRLARAVPRHDADAARRHIARHVARHIARHARQHAGQHARHAGHHGPGYGGCRATAAYLHSDGLPGEYEQHPVARDSARAPRRGGGAADLRRPQLPAERPRRPQRQPQPALHARPVAALDATGRATRYTLQNAL